jgi:hypothetical protein
MQTSHFVQPSVEVGLGADGWNVPIKVYGPAGQTMLLNGIQLYLDVINPVPVASSLSPASAVRGSRGFMLTVRGANFAPGCAAQWNGSARTTSFMSSNEVTAWIPATDLTTPGKARVTVLNPAPGGGTSNVLTFNVTEVGLAR